MDQRNLTMAAIIAVVLAVMVVGYVPQIQAEDYKSDRQSYSTTCVDDKPCQTTICINNQPCQVIKSSPDSSTEDTEDTEDR
ncbi:MAG TPA: hypothetical protein VJ225_06890 [Nitrososphaeraceae archaeon]|nr:hypothetical protein [Nitrososphaeraceae archaeon]